MQVSRDSTFESIALEVAGFPETQFTPPTNLADSSSYTWRVRATTVYGVERWSENRLPFTVDVTPPATRLLEPNGGEHWVNGQMARIRWSVVDWSGLDSLRIAVSLDDGQSFTVIARPAITDTLLDWALPDSFVAARKNLCRVRLEAWDRATNLGSDQSDRVFTILQPTDAEDRDEQVRSPRIALGPVLPNPMRGTAAVSLALPHPQRIRLTVVDVRGRELLTLLDGALPAGRHRIAVSEPQGKPLTLPNGVYFLRLESDGNTHHARFVVLR